MTTRTCAECVYWEGNEFSKPDKLSAATSGYCHRFPPQPCPDGTDGDISSNWHFPYVDSVEWCGEWESTEPPPPRETKPGFKLLGDKEGE